MLGLAFNASAESITGISDVQYDVKFGDWYDTAANYAGAQYHYALGVSRTVSATSYTDPTYGVIYDTTYSATNGFGEAGDSYTVYGTDHVFNDPMISGHQFWGTGQLSWCQAGLCAGGSGTSAGWNHTSQHVLFSVTTEADIQITLSNAPGAEGHDGPNETATNAIGGDLKPGFTLFSGISTSGWNEVTHTFTNTQDFTLNPLTTVNKKGVTVTQVPTTTDLFYVDSNANTANSNTVSETFHLPVGLYSLWIGGNFSNIANNDSSLPCDTTISGGVAAGHCTGYGTHGKNFMLNIQTAPVPIPAAAWLFGTGLAGLGAFSRRKAFRV